MIEALCCRLTNRLIDWSPRRKLKKAQEKPDSDECFSPVMGNINMIHSVRTNKCIHKENGGVGGSNSGLLFHQRTHQTLR